MNFQFIWVMVTLAMIITFNAFLYTLFILFYVLCIIICNICNVIAVIILVATVIMIIVLFCPHQGIFGEDAGQRIQQALFSQDGGCSSWWQC